MAASKVKGGGQECPPHTKQADDRRLTTDF
jgi:hypothetical protein